MEKEIYLTEAPYINELSQTNQPFKEKSLNNSYANRENSGKANLKRILEHYPPEQYYADKKIKPGASLYKTILEIQERRSNGQYTGPYLKLSIPETALLNDNTNCIIYQENQTVKVQPFATNQRFAKSVILQKTDQHLFPSIIQSSVAGTMLSNSIIMNSEVIASKIFPRSEGLIVRKFIEPFAMTPNIFRLFYISKNSKQLKRNYAYKLVSSKQMDEELFKKKHRLTQCYILNSEHEDTYTATIIKGKALEASESMATSLLQYLQHAINIKISEMVIDFIIDENKKLWFHELKGIRNKEVTNLWQIGNQQEIELITKHNNNLIMCRLCGISHARYQIEKIVTNKLIEELSSHIRYRGQHIANTPLIKKEGLSHVCNVCYDVIVAEHKLIDLQKQFSKLLNICQNSIQRVIPIPKENLKKVKLEFLNEEDFQPLTVNQPTFKSWRLFFYIENVKNYQRKDDTNFTNITLDMKFKNLKEKFTKKIQHEQLVHSKLFKSRNSMMRVQSAKSIRKSNINEQSKVTKMTCSKTRIYDTTQASKISTAYSNQFALSKEFFSLQKVKIYVFYTKSNQSTHQVFANSSMEFTLHINDEKFTGTSSTLQQLKNKDTCQRHCTEIFLFDEKLKYCNLELTVGLICDGEVNDSDLELQESDGIYLPVKTSSNCRPLPDQWMEVFTQGQQLPQVGELTYEEVKQNLMKKQTKIRTQVAHDFSIENL